MKRTPPTWLITYYAATNGKGGVIARALYRGNKASASNEAAIQAPSGWGSARVTRYTAPKRKNCGCSSAASPSPVAPRDPQENPSGVARLSAILGAGILDAGAPSRRPRARGLTLAQLTAAVKRLGGVKLRRVEGEYRVAFTGLSPHNEELSAYYTMDAEDALATAKAMAAERKAP